MTNNDLLQSKIEELEMILDEKDKLIKQQQNLIDQLITERQQPYINPYIPYQPMCEGNCPAGGWHDYPTPWHGTSQPFCKKCGQPAPYTGFYYTTTTDVNTNINKANTTDNNIIE